MLIDILTSIQDPTFVINWVWLIEPVLLLQSANNDLQFAESCCGLGTGRAPIADITHNALLKPGNEVVTEGDRENSLCHLEGKCVHYSFESLFKSC